MVMKVNSQMVADTFFDRTIADVLTKVHQQRRLMLKLQTDMEISNNAKAACYFTYK